MSAGIVVAFVIIVLATAVSGLTGFGLAVVGVPPLMLIYEPATVVVLIAIVSLFTNAVIVQDSWREIEVRAVLSLLPWAGLGLLLGTEILRSVNAEYIRLAVGVIVILAAILLLRQFELPGIKGRWGTAVAGVTSGALSTSTGIAGPPVVLLFAARRFPKASFRVSNAAYFLALSVGVISALLARGILEFSHLWLSVALVPAAFAGKMLGTTLVKRLSNKAFRNITLGVVLLTGSLGVLTAAWALL